MTCAPVIRLHLAHVKKRKRFGTTDCQFRNSSLAVHMWSSACGRAECSRPRLAMLCADVRFSPSMLVSKLSSPSSGYCQNQSPATRWNAVSVPVSFAVNVCRVGGPPLQGLVGLTSGVFHPRRSCSLSGSRRTFHWRSSCRWVTSTLADWPPVASCGCRDSRKTVAATQNPCQPSCDERADDGTDQIDPVAP